MEFKLNQNIATFIDVSHVLGTFEIDEPIEKFIEKNTTTYLVRKHDQSWREIIVPSLKLKTIQKWLVKNILGNVSISESAHGFVKGKSIMTNVQSHIHSADNWLMRIDIKNFFPSISSESVLLIFEKLGYPRDVSRILSNLCTKDGKLCQGFSTSPVLANIYMIEFDSKLNSVIEKQNYEYNLVYTRYADDIIVSGLKISGYMKIVRDIRDDVEKILAESNLRINKRKTSIQKKERKKLLDYILKIIK